MHFPLTSTQCTVRLFIGIPSPFYTLKLYVQINPQIHFLCIKSGAAEPLLDWVVGKRVYIFNF